MRRIYTLVLYLEHFYFAYIAIRKVKVLSQNSKILVKFPKNVIASKNNFSFVFKANYVFLNFFIGQCIINFVIFLIARRIKEQSVADTLDYQVKYLKIYIYLKETLKSNLVRKRYRTKFDKEMSVITCYLIRSYYKQ